VPIAATDEQLALQASIRDWAKRAGPLALVRRMEPGSDVGGADASGPGWDGPGWDGPGWDGPCWGDLAGLGVFSIALPAAAGGTDGTVTDLAAALEELTPRWLRARCCPPCAASSDFGAVAVADRRHAAANPNAWFHQRPITLADHQGSRWIAEPLRLLDCCQESDGAVAVVVTSLGRARDLRQPPAVIRASAQGSGPDQFTMTSYYRDDLTGLPEMGVVGGQISLARQFRSRPAGR
jgi:hypothetical protein